MTLCRLLASCRLHVSLRYKKQCGQFIGMIPTCAHINCVRAQALGARGSVDSLGTVQQVRSWVRFPMRSLEFFNRRNPSSHTVALRSTRHVTETSTRNLSGGKGRPACKPDNLTAICEPIV
jgi:hypothetical protein